MRATQNRIEGHFSSAHYLGAAVHRGGPGAMSPIPFTDDSDGVEVTKPPVFDTGITIPFDPGSVGTGPMVVDQYQTPPPQYVLASGQPGGDQLPPILTTDQLIKLNTGPAFRTGTVFTGNGGGAVGTQKPRRQSGVLSLDPGPDIVPVIYPVDPNGGVTTLPTLTPTSNPVPTVTTPVTTTPTTTVVTQPTLTPTSNPVPTVTTTPTATVPSATPLTTVAAAMPGYVTIFGMQIPTIWLWIGGAVVAVYFLFGGSSKKR